MSAVLNRTLGYLSQTISTLSQPGPGWAFPEEDAPPDANLPPGLAHFLDSLHQCQTRQDERRLAAAHLAKLEERLRQGSPTPAAVADAMVRVMACHVLGHEAPFAKIYALQLAQKGTTLEKKMGYLACTLLLNDRDEETLLLVNTLVKDLSSKNILEVSAALTAMAHLVPKEMSSMVVPMLLDKTTHSKDFIRKKALVCLQHTLAKDPSVASQMESRVLACLGDTDPGVVAVAVQVCRSLCLLKFGTKSDRSMELVPTLLAVQVQVLANKVPKDYVRNGFPHPWLQVDILNLVRLILEKNTVEGPKSSLVHAVDGTVGQTLDASCSTKDSGAQAVTEECLRLSAVLSVIRPDEQRKSRALAIVGKLLQSKHSNSRYVGLASLEFLVIKGRVRASQGQEEGVMGCLAHADPSVQAKAVSLLHALAGPDNVKAICAKLVECVRDDDDADVFRKKELVDKAVDLVQRFDGGGLEWKVRTLLKLLQAASPEGRQRQTLLQKIKAAVSPREEKNKAEADEVGQKLTRLLGRNVKAEKGQANDSVLGLYFWCSAHFYPADSEGEDDAVATANELCLLCESLEIGSSQKLCSTQAACLEAVFTLLPSFGKDDFASSPTEEFVKKCSRSRHDQISDLAEEILTLAPHVDALARTAAGRTDECEDFTASYLDAVVVDAIKSRKLNPFKVVPVVDDERRRDEAKAEELKFSPYMQLDKESLSRISDPVSPAELDEAGLPSLWSASGRAADASAVTTTSEQPEESARNVIASGLLADPSEGQSDLEDAELNQFSSRQ